ncbi:Rpn family recombination-promoting nuclease/putative transposase [Rickettsiella endosymbiont of Miltochrista miniata]|uniref:Rpn family recombination-promoting nuclease/putative transposase n=1 Tax=Rickettsiella endosymbiont of Miltochrista miniata TaxID=3066239 RepID=UPI00313C56DB
MAISIHHPHDSLFRNYLADINMAKTFFEVYLPNDIKILCDFSSLKLEPGSFVEKNLRKHFSDILYSVQMKDDQGYLYPLIEHETTPEKMTPFKISRYVHAIMDQHLKQGHVDLPIVVPILYYRGKVIPYPFTGNIFDCFGKNKTLAEKIYLRPYPITDISSMSDEEIKKHGNIAILDFAQKYSCLNRDIQDGLENIVEELNKGYLSSEQCQTLLYYIFRETEAYDVNKLLEKLQTIRIYEADIMSIAQKIEQLGLQKGLQQGREEGRHEEAMSVAKNMLAKRFNVALIKELTGLSDQDLLSLEN